MSNSLIKIQEYLLYSLPFLMITGPFLSDGGLTLICIMFLINQFMHKRFNILKIDKFGKFFFIWCLYLIGLSVFSEDPLLSFESSLFFFRYGIFVYAIIFIIKNNEYFLRYFYFSLIFAILFVIFDGLIQYFFGTNIFGYEYDGYRFGLFNDTKFFGHYLIRLLPILFAIGIYFYSDSKINLAFLMIIFILSDILIFLSGERTSFFLLLLFTGGVLLLISKWKLIRILTVALSFILVLLILNVDGSIKQRMVTQTVNQTNWGVTFSPEHDLLYESAINMFLDNPIFGVGPKIFRLKCADKKYAKDIFGYRNVITTWDENNSCSTHPHNMYIQLLAETGLLGAIPFIVFFLFISMRLLKHLYSVYISRTYLYSDYVVMLLLSVFVQLWPIIPHSSVFNNRVNVFIFLTIGLLAAGKYVQKK